MKTLSLYIDNGSWLTRLHPFSKLWYLTAAILVPPAAGILNLYFLTILCSLLLLCSGQILRKTVPLIVFSFSLILTVFLIHGILNQENRTLLFSIGFLRFYREGLFYALRIGLNILNMLLAFSILVLSTRPSELVEELEQKGFSPRFGYIITSVFQILPQMISSVHTILDAQKSRGMETEGSLRIRARAFLPLISPVVMSTLTSARERAVALEIRGFGSSCKKTALNIHKKSGIDRLIAAASLLCMAAAAGWRILKWL